MVAWWHTGAEQDAGSQVAEACVTARDAEHDVEEQADIVGAAAAPLKMQAIKDLQETDAAQRKGAEAMKRASKAAEDALRRKKQAEIKAASEEARVCLDWHLLYPHPGFAASCPTPASNLNAVFL